MPITSSNPIWSAEKLEETIPFGLQIMDGVRLEFSSTDLLESADGTVRVYGKLSLRVVSSMKLQI